MVGGRYLPQNMLKTLMSKLYWSLQRISISRLFLFPSCIAPSVINDAEHKSILGDKVCLTLREENRSLQTYPLWLF